MQHGVVLDLGGNDVPFACGSAQGGTGV